MLNIKHAEYKNQRLTVKNYLEECLQWMDSKRNYSIQSNIEKLLGNIVKWESNDVPQGYWIV